MRGIEHPGMSALSAATAYGLVLLTVLFTVYGQFAIKWQVMRSPPVPSGVSEVAAYILQLLLSPLVISGIAAAFLASVAWMLALTRLPLNHAYPMTALTLVVVVIGSNWLFGEPVNALKLTGVLLIVAGIVIGSQG
jgi:multidrug transporter EmrE-like cation transporter